MKILQFIYHWIQGNRRSKAYDLSRSYNRTWKKCLQLVKLETSLTGFGKRWSPNWFLICSWIKYLNPLDYTEVALKSSFVYFTSNGSFHWCSLSDNFFHLLKPALFLSKSEIKISMPSKLSFFLKTLSKLLGLKKLKSRKTTVEEENFSVLSILTLQNTHTQDGQETPNKRHRVEVLAENLLSDRSLN